MGIAEYLILALGLAGTIWWWRRGGFRCDWKLLPRETLLIEDAKSPAMLMVAAAGLLVFGALAAIAAQQVIGTGPVPADPQGAEVCRVVTQQGQGLAVVYGLTVPAALMAFFLLRQDDEVFDKSSWKGRRLVVGAFKLIGLGVTATVIALACGLLIKQGLALAGVPSPQVAHSTLSILRRLAQLSGDTPGVDEARLWQFGLIASAVIGAPIVEEVMYRGFLQRAIRGSLHGGGGFSLKSARWMAIAISGAVFAALHIGVVPIAALAVALPQLFVLSMLLGLAYERSGRIVVPIVMHAMFNLVSVSLTLMTA